MLYNKQVEFYSKVTIQIKIKYKSFVEISWLHQNNRNHSTERGLSRSHYSNKRYYPLRPVKNG